MYMDTLLDWRSNQMNCLLEALQQKLELMIYFSADFELKSDATLHEIEASLNCFQDKPETC